MIISNSWPMWIYFTCICMCMTPQIAKKGSGTATQSTCLLRGYGTPLYCDVLHINKIIYIFKIFSFPWLLATCNQARSIVFEGKGRGGDSSKFLTSKKKKQKKKRGTFQNLQKPNPRGRGGGVWRSRFDLYSSFPYSLI